MVDTRTGTPWVQTPTGSTWYNNTLADVRAPYDILTANQGKSKPQMREWRFRMSGNVQLAAFTDRKHLKRVTVGGSVRWEDKGAIGYYGVPVNGDIRLATQLDANRPIWDGSNFYADMFVSYRMRLFDDKVRARFQLNVQNLQEDGGLRTIAAYPDGSGRLFRILDPRLFIFTASFDL